MRQYFEKMEPLVKQLTSEELESMKGSFRQSEEVMKRIDSEVQRIKNFGVPVVKDSLGEDRIFA
jgi:16S rRNA G527 N7-methylase RsmG